MRQGECRIDGELGKGDIYVFHFEADKKTPHGGESPSAAYKLGS